MKNEPYYSLENFIIKINFDMSEIKTEDPNSIEQLGEIIHEYTHYLQSITTIYGISILTIYLDLLIKITVDVYGEIVHGQVNTYNIIEKYRDDFSRLSKRLHWERMPRNLNIQRAKPDYFFKQISNPNINGEQTEEAFLYNIHDSQYYHLSTSVLRENMAMMAFFYAHGIGQDAVMDYVISKNLSCKYWIVFSYFLYNYPQIKNMIIFTYYFCELSLMDLVPSLSVKKLLLEIKKLIKTVPYTDEDNFFKLLSNRFQNKIRENFSIITDVINKMEIKIEKLSHYHDFYFLLKEIIDLCKKGIDYRKYNGTIFRTILDGRWINNMSSQFFSPLILQPHGKFSVIGNRGNYDEKIGQLFGVASVIQKLLRHEKIYCCPFHDEIPICKLFIGDNKLENICITEPVNMRPFPRGGCLFYNISLILGLLPIEEYKNYIDQYV